MLPRQPVKVEKLALFSDQSPFVELPFGNGLQYRNYDFPRLNRMNFSVLCTILMTFGLVSPEFTLLSITPFAAIWQKSAYHTKSHLFLIDE